MAGLQLSSTPAAGARAIGSSSSGSSSAAAPRKVSILAADHPLRQALAFEADCQDLARLEQGSAAAVGGGLYLGDQLAYGQDGTSVWAEVDDRGVDTGCVVKLTTLALVQGAGVLDASGRKAVSARVKEASNLQKLAQLQSRLPVPVFRTLALVEDAAGQPSVAIVMTRLPGESLIDDLGKLPRRSVDDLPPLVTRMHGVSPRRQ